MKKTPILIILISFLNPSFLAAQSMKARDLPPPTEYPVAVRDGWHKTEKLRKEKEEALLEKYSKYLSKKTKPLIERPWGNFFLTKNPGEAKDVEYSIKTDSEKIVTRNYCSLIGKCIGYNNFGGSGEVVNSEFRLVDVVRDNAIFYHFFLTESEGGGPSFDVINLHSGRWFTLYDAINFSPDKRVIVKFRSLDFCAECTESNTGFNIDIYEINDKYDYVLTSRSEERDSDDLGNSYFLSRHPQCGPTPFFHSWKNNNEIRISMIEPSKANSGDRVILKYDSQAKNWSCKRLMSYFQSLKRLGNMTHLLPTDLQLPYPQNLVQLQRQKISTLFAEIFCML